MERVGTDVNSTDPVAAMKDDEHGIAAIGHRVENARSILSLVESVLSDDSNGEHYIEDARNAVVVAMCYLETASTHAFDLDEILRSSAMRQAAERHVAEVGQIVASKASKMARK